MLVAALVTLVLGGATAAQAHAVLESSTPAAGSVAATAPGSVRLHFGEPVEISTGSLRVLDGNGSAVQAGAPTHPAGTGSDVAVPLKTGLADGSYLVLWRVVSADSHPVDGTFTFSVGHPGAVASGTAAGTDHLVSGLLSVSRGVGYLGLAVFLGGVWFVLLCWPAGGAVTRTVRLVAAGWVVAIVGAVGALLLQGPYAAGLGLGDTLTGQVVSGTVHSRYGHAVLLRLLLLAVAAGLGWWGLRRPGWRAGTSFTVAAAATAATFVDTGHAGTGVQVPVAVVSDIAHLSAMSLWLGGLVMLAGCALSRTTPAEARAAASRFSPLALTSVLVLIASGTYQGWRQAGVLASLTTTYYGELLLVKIGLVTVVVVIAFFSRRWVRRHRQRVVVAAHSDTSQVVDVPAMDSDHRQLRLTVGLEAALLVVVLGVTSVLVAAPPARSSYRPSTALDLTTGPVTVQLSIVPKGSRLLDLHFYTFSASGETLAVPELDASMTLPSKDIGPIAIPLSDIDGTHFLATAVQLPATGTWTLRLKVRTTAIDEFDTTTKVMVR